MWRAAQAVIVLLVLAGAVLRGAGQSIDKFGITQLHHTSSREWFNSWDGPMRTISSGSFDPEDPEAQQRGTSGLLAVHGNGEATMSGISPRHYIRCEEMMWLNVEATVYAQRDSEMAGVPSYAGVAFGLRSNHHIASTDPCEALTYYGRMTFDGRVSLLKEFYHGNISIYANSMTVNRWPSGMPNGEWLGLKLVSRSLNDDAVHLQLYIDESGGADGGEWELVLETVDSGSWTARDPIPAACEWSAGQVITRAAHSTFLRSDFVNAIHFRHFSVREVEAPVAQSAPGGGCPSEIPYVTSSMRVVGRRVDGSGTIIFEVAFSHAVRQVDTSAFQVTNGVATASTCINVADDMDSCWAVQVTVRAICNGLVRLVLPERSTMPLNVKSSITEAQLVSPHSPWCGCCR